MVSCDDETLSSRSYWCRSQPSSKVTQGLFGVTYVSSSWWDHQGATEHFGRENGRKQHAACIDFHIFQWIFGGGSRGFLIDPREWSKMRCIKECITASITWNSPHLDHLEFTSFRVTYYYILLYIIIMESYHDYPISSRIRPESCLG